MEPVRSGCFCAFILFLAVRLRAADCAKVIVGDPFKIPISCEPGRLLRDLGDDGTREVATGQSGQWKVSREEDRDRIKIDSSNIVFTHTLYTDGGIYELTCSTSGTKETIQLEVVVASEKSVTQGDKVTLPCYFKTIRGTGLPGWWERNGKHVCVKNFNYEGCSGTPADRLTVSTDWITTGDLSLTIEEAQPGDSGDYFCYTQDGKRSGKPAAVRLTVIEKKSHQMISSTAAPGNPTQSCAEHTQPWQMSTWVLAVILLLVALVALRLWCRGKINFDSGKLYELVQRRCHASNSTEATTSV
ncbi:uncharacterized protein LOC106938451 isoform X1 [Poecilia latipinna]|uniref:uncharacterized protein LOC106938451 isoform X1 n=1 Tax=Poecilia latipinna TaxID=48699 RepID=UPI00072DB7DD|nr:PREDICTED: uncharacterized protein LOC106938451 isoform X1 [Poecilia latipinna]